MVRETVECGGEDGGVVAHSAGAAVGGDGAEGGVGEEGEGG